MKLNLILSTDLLSRGVDLPEVRFVINFDMPLTQAEFLHRIGRSGRFGSEGTAISLITSTDLNLDYIGELIQSGMSELTLERVQQQQQQITQNIVISKILVKE